MTEAPTPSSMYVRREVCKRRHSSTLLSQEEPERQSESVTICWLKQLGFLESSTGTIFFRETCHHAIECQQLSSIKATLQDWIRTRLYLFKFSLDVWAWTAVSKISGHGYLRQRTVVCSNCLEARPCFVNPVLLDQPSHTFMCPMKRQKQIVPDV